MSLIYCSIEKNALYVAVGNAVLLFFSLLEKYLFDYMSDEIIKK
jgi:hypothetical protein